MHRKITGALKNLSGVVELVAINIEAKVTVDTKDCVGPESIDHLAWRRLWTQAIQDYRILMSAMARSQVRVLEFGGPSARS
ncbi:hypothetical protein PG994_007043 [Apiospora phragmitis]|uniref:Uncharacterized protein n=1 Tax=Apiospora phragmitis TaxID=2905665 RepID=A0ABR1UZQ6_9PEZI